jgi:8-amino-7-oxononanoate synthase
LIYSSPPSVASIRAAEAALAINRDRGDRLRTRLAERVVRFRTGLLELGLIANGGLSPVQSLEIPAGVDPLDLDRQLKTLGIQAVPRQGRCRPGPWITFLLRADHTAEEIDQAITSLARLVRQTENERF